MIAPSLSHWYVSVPPPVAATVSVGLSPRLTVTATGCVEKIGGASAAITVSVKIWFTAVLLPVPLLAVIVTANGEPLEFGGVPLMTPVLELIEAQDGRPVAL